jgi:hypothetical protein
VVRALWRIIGRIIELKKIAYRVAIIALVLLALDGCRALYNMFF